MSPPPSPATTETDRAEIRDRFGIDDQWPVVCEPFTQWVLQDTFAATPTLAPVPGVGLKGYKHTLIERLANPQIRDTIARLCAESSDRIPKFLLPVIRAQLTTGGEIRRSAAVVASWARYAEGTDEQGEPIEVVDRLAGRLMPAARRQREDLLAFIADQDVFGGPSRRPALRRRLHLGAGLAAPARGPGDAGIAGLTEALIVIVLACHRFVLAGWPAPGARSFCGIGSCPGVDAKDGGQRRRREPPLSLIDAIPCFDYAAGNRRRVSEP
jgi:hypothetical protein